VSESSNRQTVKRWPLVPIAAPAAVAIWSGWVGLGGMCGFGLVQPLPGIVAWHLNTAISLPVGVEAYGAFALGAWLTPGTPERARSFARGSAIGALALGALGQVVYHLLAAAHQVRAPWPVVVLVACLPVVTLGFGAALTHLLRSEPAPAVPAPQPAAPDVPDPQPEPPPETERPSADAEFDRLLEWLTSGGDDVPGVPELHQEAEAMFAADLVAGRLPGIRAIREGLRVGQDKATQVQAYLRPLARTP
jgi:hypothetical protein